VLISEGWVGSLKENMYSIRFYLHFLFISEFNDRSEFK
jgi:hypothetical protein